MSTPAPVPKDAPANDPPLYHIRPSKGWIGVDFGELWDYRELLFFLIWRDVKVRYKQTVIGAAWAIIQPLLMMVVFTFIFGRVAGMAEGTNIPYTLLTLCALVPWQFFSGGLQKASESLVASANMVKKVFFPRLLAPMASVLSGLVDFLIASVVLAALLVYSHFSTSGWEFHLRSRLLLLPVFMLVAYAASQGLGFWLAAMNVQFRDVKYIVPFFIQLLTFVSPVGFPISKIPEAWRAVYALNPMAGVIAGFRWALLADNRTGFEPISAPWIPLLVSAGVAVALLVSGTLFFRRMERHFADVV